MNAVAEIEVYLRKHGYRGVPVVFKDERGIVQIGVLALGAQWN